VHATSHRLFFISSVSQAFPSSSSVSSSSFFSSSRPSLVSNPDDEDSSFVLDLARVSTTDYYAGLFASSAKVTLHLSRPALDSSSSASNANTHLSGGSSSGIDVNSGDSAFAAWECEVCAFRNPPGLSPQAARICGLCGVPRSAVPEPSKSMALRLYRRSSRARRITQVLCLRPVSPLLLGNHSSLRAPQPTRSLETVSPRVEMHRMYRSIRMASPVLPVPSSTTVTCAHASSAVHPFQP
jgi:hypothetical protein